MEKEIVILAKSIKHRDFCIAGKDIETGEWVRPVSTRDGDAISNEQSKAYFTNETNQLIGYPCKLLQKVRIPFLGHVPLNYQRENYLIDNNRRWQQNFKINTNQLSDYLDHPENLWGSNQNYICADMMIIQNPNRNSLYLIEVTNVDLTAENDISGHRRRRISFEYNGSSYNFACTDPNFDNILGNNDSMNFTNLILCVSLGENYQGRHYKLVAAIHLI